MEVCIGGRYGTICDEGWDNLDASVVCRQLGFSPYGELRTLSRWIFDGLNFSLLTAGSVAIVNENFGENTLPVSLTKVQCTGSESAIVDCVNSTTPCNPFQDAGVVCQGELAQQLCLNSSTYLLHTCSEVCFLIGSKHAM